MLRSRRLTAPQLILTALIAAIVATVVALAINSYYQYFLRVRIASGTAKLAAMRLSMGRYSQKNLSYNSWPGRRAGARRRRSPRCRPIPVSPTAVRP